MCYMFQKLGQIWEGDVLYRHVSSFIQVVIFCLASCYRKIYIIIVYKAIYQPTSARSIIHAYFGSRCCALNECIPLSTLLCAAHLGTQAYTTPACSIYQFIYTSVVSREHHSSDRIHDWLCSLYVLN